MMCNSPNFNMVQITLSGKYQTGAGTTLGEEVIFLFDIQREIKEYMYKEIYTKVVHFNVYRLNRSTALYQDWP